MSDQLQLQLGGTLNPRQHLYIVRDEDEKFFQLLEQGEYVNVLSSRQMGKSSLMMQAVRLLSERGIRSVTIDLASELGTPADLDAFCLGLLSKIARVLALKIDLRSWWQERGAETVNQRLLRFFREIVGNAVEAPVVIFLDEIDSTLKLAYTDDLFTALRGMYNERPMVDAYRRITFCLLGVATPNELIKDRRTTAYNVGTVLTLRDFDRKIDDLTPFVTALGPDTERSTRLLDRVLHWSGGQPYLTQKLCADVIEQRVVDGDEVDTLVDEGYGNLGQASNEVHFQQILRFLEDRLTDETATIDLYAKILNNGRVPDRTTLANAELKLSGLVKRDGNGDLVVRNPIYRRLFDNVWVKRTRPQRDLLRTRQLAFAVSLVLTIVLGGGAYYYVTIVRPAQTRLDALDRLSALKISITDTASGTRAAFPASSGAALIQQAIPLLKTVGQVTELSSSREAAEVGVSRGFSGEMRDLSPIAELKELQRLDLSGLSVFDLRPLRQLKLKSLRIGKISIRMKSGAEVGEGLQFSTDENDRFPFSDISPLRDMQSLEELSVFATRVADIEPLTGLSQLKELNITGTLVKDLEPLRSAYSLARLSIALTDVRDLEPISQLISLVYIYAADIDIKSVLALSGLVRMNNLVLRDTNVDDASPLERLVAVQSLDLGHTRISDLTPLQSMKGLSSLSLNQTGVTDVSPLTSLTNLITLDLSNTPLAKVLPLASLKKLKVLTLRGTRASTEDIDELRKRLPETRVEFEESSPIKPPSPRQ